MINNVLVHGALMGLLGGLLWWGIPRLIKLKRRYGGIYPDKRQ